VCKREREAERGKDNIKQEQKGREKMEEASRIKIRKEMTKVETKS
jgi:hypothetical protein